VHNFSPTLQTGLSALERRALHVLLQAREVIPRATIQVLGPLLLWYLVRVLRVRWQYRLVAARCTNYLKFPSVSCTLDSVRHFAGRAHHAGHLCSVNFSTHSSFKYFTIAATLYLGDLPVSGCCKARHTKQKRIKYLIL
jgi:hypothetical protein